MQSLWMSYHYGQSSRYTLQRDESLSPRPFIWDEWQERCVAEAFHCGGNWKFAPTNKFSAKYKDGHFNAAEMSSSLNRAAKSFIDLI